VGTCLPSKHKALNLNPRAAKIYIHTCIHIYIYVYLKYNLSIMCIGEIIAVCLGTNT
jgi:hypothetical protein